MSVLTDYFPAVYRGTVVGIYNLGIYSGYSLSYALGNFITLANINNEVSAAETCIDEVECFLHLLCQKWLWQCVAHPVERFSARG